MRALVYLIVFLPMTLISQQLDQSGQKALRQTIELLNNPIQRQKAIQENIKSKKANSYAQDIAGSPENLDKIYKLSSKIFQRMAEKSGGNTNAMNETLSNASRDPSSFSASMSEEEKALLKEISDKISESKSSFKKH